MLFGTLLTKLDQVGDARSLAAVVPREHERWPTGSEALAAHRTPPTPHLDDEKLEVLRPHIHTLRLLASHAKHVTFAAHEGTMGVVTVGARVEASARYERLAGQLSKHCRRRCVAHPSTHSMARTQLDATTRHATTRHATTRHATTRHATSGDATSGHEPSHIAAGLQWRGVREMEVMARVFTGVDDQQRATRHMRRRWQQGA
jgi:hypothetical protein